MNIGIASDTIRLMTVPESLALARQYHQSGNLARAAAIYRQVLQTDTNNSAALFYLGSICENLGQLADAVLCFQRLTALRPNDFQGHYRLGLAFHGQGKLAEAILAYRNALRLKPDDAETNNNLGVALKGQGQLIDAVACYEKALRLQPDYAEAHNNLGAAFREQGKLEKAIACYRRALELKPNYAQAYSNLGNALRQSGQSQEALDCYHQALQHLPGYVDAHYNLGVTLMEMDRTSDAEAAFRQALQLRPAFPEALNNLGNVLQHQKRLGQAVVAYRQAIQLRPNFADAMYNLGNVLRDQGEVDEAIKTYQQALNLQPDYPEVHNNLAYLFEEQGQPLKAQHHALEALRLRPDWAPPLFTLAELAQHGHYNFPDAQLKRMETLLDNRDVTLSDKSQLHFAVALLRDKAGEHEQAFVSYRDGNTLKRQLLQETGMAFQPREFHEFINELIGVFNTEFFEQMRELGSNTELPVFIVGMPRSGTTLVEQILASHPKVFGAGELRDVGKLVAELPARLDTKEPYPRCITNINQSTGKAMADDYLRQITRRGGTAIRITDKAIQNFLHVGLLAALFPKARIIHCRRDPRDVCVSCYLQYFRELNFTWDLGDLGFYYRQYERLMEHWRAVLPVKPLEVVYEELVAHQEPVSRQIVTYCGLEWDRRCLSFHDNARAVQTMSKLQVRQPIYSSSVGRWKRYESHLQPLLNALSASDSEQT